MRSGVSYICKTKYLKSYDLEQESKHILYLDANKLYCSAMSKFLQKANVNE